jgi:ribokinase
MPAGDAASAEAAARTLLDRGGRSVVVTMGAAGALLVDESGTRAIRPFAVDAVDTTGAGDAFIGSFAHFYVETGAAEPSLNLAARYAAQSTLKRGTQKSFPTAEEFAAF